MAHMLGGFQELERLLKKMLGEILSGLKLPRSITGGGEKGWSPMYHD